MLNYYQKAKNHPEIFKQLFCKELLFVYYDCPLGSNKQDSWSQYNYILYMVTGTKAFYTATKSWVLTKGSAVFVKKGACVIEKLFGEDLCLMAFFIPDSYLRSFLLENNALLQTGKNNMVDDELVIKMQVNEMMVTYYDSLMPYFSSDFKPPEDLLELKFKELLFNIIGNPVNVELNNYLTSLTLPQSNNMQQVINTNLFYNLNLEDYAKLCNRSLSSFKRDFFKLNDMAPAQWILNKRLAYALKLLCSTEKSVNDISFESGFESSSHFSRVFKKRYGKSPLQYRCNEITNQGILKLI